MDSKCFGISARRAAIPALLILVDRLCFDRYKIDYTLQVRARIAGSRFETQLLMLDAFGNVAQPV
jgi:hypothetical protein